MLVYSFSQEEIHLEIKAHHMRITFVVLLIVFSICLFKYLQKCHIFNYKNVNLIKKLKK